MASNYAKGLYKEYELLLSAKEAVDAQNKLLQRTNHILQKKVQLKAHLEAEQNAQIEALKKEVQRLHALMGIDGTNSGLPTSKTPLRKKKVIPNSRKKSGKAIGGQPGHPKAKLEAFAEEEITEVEFHSSGTCAFCGSEDIAKTKSAISKDELDYEVVVIKRRHQFPIYKCQACSRTFHQLIPVRLKEDNQYGSHVQTLSLALMNVGNVSVNKTRKMLYGLSEEEIHPSEGYLTKLQKRAARDLTPFLQELKRECVKQEILYWDDTVIAIHGTNGCLRFYGNEQLALYTAHLQKNKQGLDADGILNCLASDTIVMHDHNRVNYNQAYSFKNIECNAHLLRDLQKTTDNLQHNWSAKLKALLEQTNADRNDALSKGEEQFSDAYVKAFFESFNCIMRGAAEENHADYNKYYGQDELVLILRILDYKNPYLGWVSNFDLPFTNNLSERGLRGVKSKLKIAGQFQSEESAGYYATIRSYLETCYRNDINETNALQRLCEGNPYTLTEIFSVGSGV